MNLQKQAIMLTAILSMLGSTLIISSALANPSFVETPTIEKNSNSGLTANFNATGLKNQVTTAILSSSGGDAGLTCVDLSGKGSAPKLFSFNAQQGHELTIQPVNGEISNSSTMDPPQLPSTSEFCFVSALNIEIESITYEDVVLHIKQNGVDVLRFDFGSVGP